jgi:predicted RNase H-like HicB family nuclease
MGEKKKNYLDLSVLVRKEGQQYSSWCPELDVASSGESIEQACENLKEAITCFIETYAELGELDAILKEKGIAVSAGEKCPSVYLTEARVIVPSVS